MSASIQFVISELRAGRFVLVCDDESREDEADLIMAAELVTKEHVNFMINHGRGLICTPMSSAVAKKLELPLMIKEHEGSFETAFTVSADVIHGTHTGISSNDRALTINALSNPRANPSDFTRPGHIFPLIAWEEGVLVRPGHTEASVDLMKLAGLNPVSSDGVPLKGEELKAFAKSFNIPIISIVELIDYRRSLDLI